MLSPQKEAAPQRSKDCFNAGRRRSKRSAAAAGLDIIKTVAKKIKKDVTKAVDEDKRAVVADWQQPTESCEDRDRDELIFDPEETQKINHIEVQKFLAAAHNKLGADTHDNMVHLMKHKGDFKEAMETIDAVDSVPNAAIHGPKGIGIWSPKEQKILISRWNLMRKKKREGKATESLTRDLQRIKKKLPQKTYANINNAFYWLKTLRCHPRKGVVEPHQFCEKKVHRALTECNIRSADCANCREKLWMKPLEEYPEDFSLCALCMLYHITWDRLRPNAAVTPEVFQFGQLDPCICNGPHMEDSVEALRKCLNKDILLIKGAKVEDLLQGLVGMNISSAVMELASSVNTDNKYVFVCRKGIKTLSTFPRFNLKVRSAAGSDENADPYKREGLRICWEQHLHSKNRLSFASIQMILGLGEKSDEWRKDFEAGKAGGPEPDCMLYGTIGTNGRITPGTDATFAEYFNRVSA